MSEQQTSAVVNIAACFVDAPQDKVSVGGSLVDVNSSGLLGVGPAAKQSSLPGCALSSSAFLEVLKINPEETRCWTNEHRGFWGTFLSHSSRGRGGVHKEMWLVTRSTSCS